MAWRFSLGGKSKGVWTKEKVVRVWRVLRERELRE